MYMKTKVIYLLLCSSMLFSCDYYKEKKAKEEAIKIEEQRAIAKQKAIEEQEAKKQEMKNNIAKYVYIKPTLNSSSCIVNDTDYTINEVVCEVFRKEKWTTNPNGSIHIDKNYNKYEQHKEYYIEAHSERNISWNDKTAKIISIKSQALGIN